MKNRLTILALLVCTLMTTTCKKGKDDPKISFLSRKARLSGDWTLVSGTVSVTYPDAGILYNDFYQFEGSEMTLNSTETGQTPIIYIGKYVLALSFKKDGTFTLSETITGTSTSKFTANGRWNFTSGVGKAKNKEGIVLQIDDVSSGANNEHLFNKFRTEFTYMITELKDKEMALEASTELNQNTDEPDKNITYSSQYKFKSSGK